MAIKIKNLIEKTENKKYTYVDIAFDLETKKTDGGKFLAKNIIESNELKTDNDINAIRNSIVNLLTTYPGQRPLNQHFGISLLPFIGDQVTTEIGQLIAEKIKNGIEKYEPRVEVKNVLINLVPDQNLYQIFIYLTPLFLEDEEIFLGGEFDNNYGLTFKKY